MGSTGEIHSRSVTDAFEQVLRMLPPAQRRTAKFEASDGVWRAFKEALLPRVPADDQPKYIQSMEHLTYVGIPVVLRDDLPKNTAQLVSMDPTVSVTIILDPSRPDQHKDNA